MTLLRMALLLAMVLLVIAKEDTNNGTRSKRQQIAFYPRRGGRPPPYAVQMEPIVQYSQRDPLYNPSASSKIDEHSYHEDAALYNNYSNEPEPIIEIIIKESNETLPTPVVPSLPPQPRPTKEPIQVFYVKYEKKKSYGDTKPRVVYDPPVPALNPVEEHEVIKPEETNERQGEPDEPVIYATEPTPIEPSTTLRAIIHPESEVYHSGSSGIRVTFGTDQVPPNNHNKRSDPISPASNTASQTSSVTPLPPPGSPKRQHGPYHPLQPVNPRVTPAFPQQRIVNSFPTQQQQLPPNYPGSPQQFQPPPNGPLNSRTQQRPPITIQGLPELQQRLPFQNFGTPHRISINHPQQPGFPHTLSVSHQSVHIHNQPSPLLPAGNFNPDLQHSHSQQQPRQPQQTPHQPLQTPARQTQHSPPHQSPQSPHQSSQSQQSYKHQELEKQRYHQEQRRQQDLRYREQQRQQEAQRQLEQQRQQEHQRKLEQQRAIEQQRQQDQQRQQERQRLDEPRRIQEQQRYQNEQQQRRKQEQENKLLLEQRLRQREQENTLLLEQRLRQQEQENILLQEQRLRQQEQEKKLLQEQQFRHQNKFGQPLIDYNQQAQLSAQQAKPGGEIFKAVPKLEQHYAIRENPLHPGPFPPNPQIQTSQYLDFGAKPFAQQSSPIPEDSQQQYFLRNPTSNVPGIATSQQAHNGLTKLQTYQNDQQSFFAQNLPTPHQQRIQTGSQQSLWGRPVFPENGKEKIYATPISNSNDLGPTTTARTYYRTSISSTTLPVTTTTTTTTTPAPITSVEPTTSSPKNEARIKENIANLPDEVPDDIREQLLSSGILGNADIQILDYDKVGGIPIENLPAEALANFYGAGGAAATAASEPVPSIAKRPKNVPAASFSLTKKKPALTKVEHATLRPGGVEMKVVHFDPNTEQGRAIADQHIRDDATHLKPVTVGPRNNDQHYNRYLPLKVSGASFPIPDAPELVGKKITSVVVLAPVDYGASNRDDSHNYRIDGNDDESRQSRTLAAPQSVKFLAGDSLKQLVRKPTTENYKKWLEQESHTEPQRQSVVLLVTTPDDDSHGDKEIFMYDVSSQLVSKLSGDLSSAFVNAAESNSDSSDNIDDSAFANY